MPKVTIGKSYESQIRGAKAAISGNMERRGYDDEKMAVKMRMQSRSFRLRIRDTPGRIKLQELWDLVEILKIPDDEILEMVKGVKR